MNFTIASVGSSLRQKYKVLHVLAHILMCFTLGKSQIYTEPKGSASAFVLLLKFFL